MFSGEADGETGVLSKATNTAVLCRKLNLDNATDLYSYCSEHLTKDELLSKRQFVLVKPEEIQRNRPGNLYCQFVKGAYLNETSF
jgi:hypothetical protein